MQKKLLVLLTSVFPYDSGEEFLEVELPYLAASFTRVIILPVHQLNPKKLTRKLPQNVEARSLRRCVPACKSAGIGLKAVSGWVRSPLLSPIPAALQMRALTSGRYRFELAKNALADVDFSRYDQAVFYGYWMAKPAMIAYWLSEWAKDFTETKCASRAHRFDVYQDQAPFGYLPARSFLGKHLDAAFPISKNAKDVLSRDMGDSMRAAMSIQRLGTRPLPEVHREKTGRLNIVSLSSLAPVKRLDLGARGIAQALRRGVDLHWYHIGGAKAEQVEDLKGLLDELQISESVTLIGQLPHEEALNFLADPKLTVFMNTSSSEGVPVSIMEALGCSLPTVCTDVGGSGELVEEGVNGSLLAADIQPNDLAEILDRWYRMGQDEYARFSKNARNTWEEKCDARNVYPKLIAEMEQM